MSVRESRVAYQRAVALFLEGRASELKTFLASSTELSQGERALVRARMHIRAKRLKAAEAELKRARGGSAFLDAEVEFLEGTLHFLGGRSQAALVSNHRAFAGYEALQDRRGQFLTAYNLSVDYEKLGLQELSHHFLGLAESRAELASEKALVGRARTCEFIRKGNDKDACQALKGAMEQLPALNWVDRLGTCAVAGDLWVQLGDFDQAIECLEQVTRHRLNRDRPRALFDLRLIRYLQGNEDFARLKGELEDSEELCLKYDLIQQARSGQLEEAARTWERLKNLSPDSFGGFLEIRHPLERRSAFARVLERLRAQQAASNETLAPASSQQNLDESAAAKLVRMYEVLRASPLPLRREEIIEKVWAQPYSPGLDSRFYKLMERVKRTYSVKIVNQNRAYYLWAQAGAPASSKLS